MVESSRWMSQLDCHPSIIIWVVFNEAWGQFNTEEVSIIAIVVFGAEILLSLFAEFWSLCAYSLRHPFLNVFLRLNFKLCLVQQGRSQSYLFSGSLPYQKVTREVMRRDPGRLVIAASGWNDFEVNLRTITESETNLILTSRWVTSEMYMFTQGRKMLMEQ